MPNSNTNTYLRFLSSRVLGTPLMITRAKLDQILGVIGGRIGLETVTIEPKAILTEKAQKAGVSRVGGGAIAKIPIHGTLVHRTLGLSALSGMTSYSTVRESFRLALNDPSVESILLDIDSPGGEVAGVFDLVDEIYTARGTKPIVAMINERGYSAAYAIASAADSIYLSRTAGVGSIGVIMLHVDRSEADKQAGLKYTPIYAGSRKIDGSPHAPLSKEASARAQETVDSVYSLFVSTVARNNNIKESVITNTEADTYRGQSAVDIGLADAVLSYQEVINNLNSNTKGGNTPMPKRNAITPEPDPKLETPDTSVTTTPVATPTPTPTPTPAALPTLTPEELQTPVITKADITVAIQAERDRCTAIMESCKIAKVTELAMDLISDGSTIETTHKMIMTVLAERSDSAVIISSVNPAKNGSTNPLLANARKRADAADQSR